MDFIYGGEFVWTWSRKDLLLIFSNYFIVYQGIAMIYSITLSDLQSIIYAMKEKYLNIETMNKYIVTLVGCNIVSLVHITSWIKLYNVQRNGTEAYYRINNIVNLIAIIYVCKMISLNIIFSFRV